MDIGRAHPGLTSLTCVFEQDSRSPITLASCAALLSVCPKLKFISTSAYRLNTVDPCGRFLGHCEFQLNGKDNDLAVELPKIASLCPLPIAQFRLYCSILCPASIEILTNLLGANLTNLQLNPNSDVTDSALVRLAQSCKRIKQLNILMRSRYSRDEHYNLGFMDEMLDALADNCPRLKTFSMEVDQGITGAGILRFAQRVGAGLTKLQLAIQKELVNPDLLVMIGSTCVNLAELTIFDNALCAEVIKAAILAPNCLPKLKKMGIYSPDHKDELLRILVSDMTLDRRWVAILNAR